MRDISTNHNPAIILTTRGTAVSEGRHHAPHQPTAAAHTTLWPIDAAITICTATHPTDIVTPHPHSPLSCRYHSSHNFMDQRRSHSSSSHAITQKTQQRKAKPHPRPSISNKPTIPRLLSSMTPHQILPHIHTVTLIL